MTHSRLEVNIWVSIRIVRHVRHGCVMCASWMRHVRCQCVMDQKVRTSGYKQETIKIMVRNVFFLELGAFLSCFGRFSGFKAYRSAFGSERG